MISSPNSLRVRQRQHTRDEIIRVAFDLFARQGYDSVPVETICAEAGISRATFFNYFPQKELLLRELAHTRMEKVRSILAALRSQGHTPEFGHIIAAFHEICEENARLVGHSKRLILEMFFRQATQGALVENRKLAIQELTRVIADIPSRKRRDPRLIAETLFAIYMATMLEWLMLDKAPQRLLVENMEKRMRLAVEGMS